MGLARGLVSNLFKRGQRLTFIACAGELYLPVFF
jgi:hypothetical protein